MKSRKPFLAKEILNFSEAWLDGKRWIIWKELLHIHLRNWRYSLWPEVGFESGKWWERVTMRLRSSLPRSRKLWINWLDQPVHPKGNQSWIFIGRTDAESPILWPPDAKNWLFGKDPDSGKDWRWEEKGMTEDGMVRWHHWLNGHEFE